MSSNLPPGVNENMIPGNRPEDEAEEKFWDDLYERGEKAGILPVVQMDLAFDHPVHSLLISLARDLGYERGLADGRADEALAQAEQHADQDEPSDDLVELRDRIYSAELESRPYAENPDDLLDEWLLPVFMAWHAEQQRLLRARIEALRQVSHPVGDRQQAIDDVLAVFDA